VTELQRHPVRVQWISRAAAETLPNRELDGRVRGVSDRPLAATPLAQRLPDLRARLAAPSG